MPAVPHTKRCYEILTLLPMAMRGQGGRSAVLLLLPLAGRKERERLQQKAEVVAPAAAAATR